MLTCVPLILLLCQLGQAAEDLPSISQLLEAGKRFLQTGDIADARAQFEEVIGKCPSCPQGYALLGLTEMLEGQYAAAVEHYRQAILHQPQDPLLHQQIANVYLQMGGWEEAEAAFQQSLKLAPGSPQALYGLAVIRFVQARYEDSIRLLEQALQQAPDKARIYYHLYAAYFNANKIERAIMALRKAIDLHPDNFSLRLQLAHLLVSRSRTPEAVSEYRKLAQLDPCNVPVRITLGFLLLNSARTKARQAFREAYRCDPAKADQFFFRSLVTLFDPEELAQRAIDLTSELELPLSPVAQHLGLAQAYRAARQLPLALQHCNHHLELNPESADGWYEKGLILEERLDLKGALEAFRRARELRMSSLELDLKMAEIWIHQNHLEEARVVLQAGLEETPLDARFHYQLGLLAEKEGDFNQALDSFRRAASLQESAEIHYRLASIARQLGDAATAAEEFRQFQQLKKLEGARNQLKIIRYPEP